MLDLIKQLTFTSISWLFLGLLLFVCGVYMGWRMRMYPFAAGLFFLGLGSCFCGLTNGFTDYSPTGRIMWRLGLPVLGLGLALVGYSLLAFI